MAASHEQTAPLFDKEQIRTVIKFNALLKRAAIDIHPEIVQVVGEEHSPDISTVRCWVRTFQGNRRASVEDMPRSGRPRSSTTQTVVDKVQKLIEEDRRITVEEVSYEIGISVGSAYHILTEKLNKTKKSARWVPHILTEEEKASTQQNLPNTSQEAQNREDWLYWSYSGCRWNMGSIIWTRVKETVSAVAISNFSATTESDSRLR